MDKIFISSKIKDSKNVGCEFLLHKKYMKLPFLDVVHKFYSRLESNDGGFKLIPPINTWSPDLNIDVLNQLFDNEIDNKYLIIKENWQILMEGIYQKQTIEKCEEISIKSFVNDAVLANNYFKTIKTADDAISFFESSILNGQNKKSLSNFNCEIIVPHENEFCFHGFNYDSLRKITKSKYIGVNIPAISIGVANSNTCFHFNDCALDSVCLLIKGAAKIWILIPTNMTYKIMAIVNTMNNIGQEEKFCRNRLHHQDIYFTIEWLQNHHIPYKIIVQRPNEFIVVRAFAIYAHFDIGTNLSTFTNFISNDWIKLSQYPMNLPPSCCCFGGNKIILDRNEIVEIANNHIKLIPVKHITKNESDKKREQNAARARKFREKKRQQMGDSKYLEELRKYKQKQREDKSYLRRELFHLKEKRDMKKKLILSLSEDSPLETQPSSSQNIHVQEEPSKNINTQCNYCGDFIENIGNCGLCKKSIHMNISCAIYSREMYICLSCLNK